MGVDLVVLVLFSRSDVPNTSRWRDRLVAMTSVTRGSVPPEIESHLGGESCPHDHHIAVVVG